MAESAGVAGQIGRVIGGALDVQRLPVRLRCWDGSVVGPDEAPCVVLNSGRALQRLIGSPDQVGLAEAYVAGDLDLDGDVFEALRLLNNGEGGTGNGQSKVARRRGLALAAAALCGKLVKPPPPREQVAGLNGKVHSRQRDRDAIRHHYDVGNEFYRLILGPTMTYSCAVWGSPEVGLEAAQVAKHDLICRKLGLTAGMRLLDVGCGWGSMVMHAAKVYGARAVGVTLSQEQADLARQRITEAGLADRVDIRVQDYREIDDGPYDAISSVGMAEHVGRSNMVTYGRCLHRLLSPCGRLLNHAISTAARDDGPPRETFISRYVFPDGELLTLGEMVSALAEAGFEIRDVEALREHYALTLRAWVANLQANWDRAVQLTSQGRARVWQLYMAGSALSFEAGRIGVNQVLCVKPTAAGDAAMPARRSV